MKPARRARTVFAVAAAVLAAAGLAWSQAASRPAVRGVEWAGKGVWLRAELHTHTRFSDGGHTVDEIAAAAVRHGCDVVAITDHTDGNLKAATPEYFTAIRDARLKYPSLTIVTGIEWNPPPGKGQEHANVFFPSGLEAQDRLAQFKERFDDYDKKGENPELALDALRWLDELAPKGLAPAVTLNHPSRRPHSTSAPRLTFEGLHRAAPRVVIGFEGGPGHQRQDPLGAYPAGTLVDRWDPFVAEVGGQWDQWLARGLDVWGASATADFHSEGNGDFWPCEFASTRLYAPDASVDGVIRALHAGSYFGEHGHIVDTVDLRVAAPGLAAPVIPGQRATVRQGTEITASLSLEIPERDYMRRSNRVTQVELIGIADGKATVLFEGEPASPDAFSVPISVPPGGIVLRARGRRTVVGQPALTFYTNPIRIATR